ncbi:helix-turn-helix transcriptional regulator [Bogoriella caseilytica]|uniref:Putative DNA-binding transcriptional regulator YafY n=1 Tax=Bogoriella caseilytica TaxID=56055 RepID=A0A3N2BGN1_9MICO|nr:WYL domain-containing protein [Bogoriella caseilytica]ROR74378.1 putative DNA-binding transcriptional regulator YafY [Bogoriella caseilytica]
MTSPSSRMLSLLSLLQSRRDWPGVVLAERLGVTPRTVRRDVEKLRELGYRVSAVRGPDGGYRLEAGSELPPLLFDDEQAIAIAIALHHAPSSGVDVGEAADRALATVRQVMPSRLRYRVDGIRFSTTGGEVRVDPQVLEAVSETVRDRRVLRFDYGTTTGPARRSEAHGLVARRGRWYLVGWDLDREDWRIYRLDRLTVRSPAGPRFTPRPVPTGEVGTFLDARAKGSADGNQWPCIGQAEIALPAAEVVPWVSDGHVDPIGERSCQVTIGSWSWAGLLASIIRFDAPFRILGPPELAEAGRTLAGRLASPSPSPSQTGA